MRIRVLPVLVLLVLTGLFALINWTTFTTPTTLNLGVATVTAPLGLVMLAVVALIGVLYVASVLALQGRAMVENRRVSRELQAQRELADKAEASRFTELRTFMSNELTRVGQSHDELRAALMSRIEQLEQRNRLLMEETANSLSAYIGEMEDRLDRSPRLRGHEVDVELPAQRPDYRPPR